MWLQHVPIYNLSERLRRSHFKQTGKLPEFSPKSVHTYGIFFKETVY